MHKEYDNDINVYDRLIKDSQSVAYFERLFNETLTFDLYKDSYVSLKIYYTSTQHTEITQTPKTTFIDLISNTGGVIGIFLGFSIFSLIEIVEIIVQIFLILIFNKKIN